MTNYQSFLASKQATIQHSGIQDATLNPMLKDFQADLTQRALAAGRYALFEDCGLGKTFQQLEWSKQVSDYTRKPVLVLTPLGVLPQTIKEGKKFNIEVERFTGKAGNSPIYVSNYEQLHNIEPIAHEFAGVVLDESSILKNFAGKTKQAIINMFADTSYKLACTATPSPNDIMEMGNHAEFLNQMSRNEMLAMYFVHDGGSTADWRMKKHGATDFYRWMATWSAMIGKPSDMGYDDTGYILPELRMHEYRVSGTHLGTGIFTAQAQSVGSHNAELAATIDQRVTKAAEIADTFPDGCDPKIIWIKLDEEGKQLSEMLPHAIEVKGSDRPEYKEEMLLAFADNQINTLITKPKIAQFGMNYQNCGTQIFPSPDFSFESVYQSIRRSLRFGRVDPVDAHFITTDTMQRVRQIFQRKQAQFDDMKNQFLKIYQQAA